MREQEGLLIYAMDYQPSKDVVALRQAYSGSPLQVEAVRLICLAEIENHAITLLRQANLQSES